MEIVEAREQLAKRAIVRIGAGCGALRTAWAILTSLAIWTSFERAERKQEVLRSLRLTFEIPQQEHHLR
jgi:hypothetical protein